MSDIYEFFKSITLFKNSMRKSWLLVTKLGPNVALSCHLHPEQQIQVNKNTYSFDTSERSTKNEYENQQFVIFELQKVFWNCIDYYVRWIFKKVLGKIVQNSTSQGKLGRTKDPSESTFQAFKRSKIQNFGKHGATSRIYWVYYNRPILSYLEVGWNVWWRYLL